MIPRRVHRVHRECLLASRVAGVGEMDGSGRLLVMVMMMMMVVVMVVMDGMEG